VFVIRYHFVIIFWLIGSIEEVSSNKNVPSTTFLLKHTIIRQFTHILVLWSDYAIIKFIIKSELNDGRYNFLKLVKVPFFCIIENQGENHNLHFSSPGEST